MEASDYDDRKYWKELLRRRVKFRWQAIEEENNAMKQAKEGGEKYYPETLSNRDTLSELLAKSRYLIYTFEEDWMANQANRAVILFEKY